MLYIVGIILGLIFCIQYKAFHDEDPAIRAYMIALIALWWPIIPAAALIDLVTKPRNRD